MKKKGKSFLTGFMVMLTLCAFAVPSFATVLNAPNPEDEVIYDADCNIFVAQKADISQESQKSPSGKVADDCCISHHCCTAKITFSNMSEAIMIAVVSVKLPILDNQRASGQIINGLDRPPKSLV